MNKIKFKFIPIKYPTKTIFLVSILSIFIWTSFITYMLVRNTPKSLVTELSDILKVKVRHEKRKSLESLKSVAWAPINWLDANFLAPEIPLIHIDIKFKHLQKIQQKRNEAIAKGRLTQGLDDYVPASIRIKDRIVKVKMRLKGDHTDHLQGNKWSFRIHVKGKDHLFGMRRLSIQNPQVRNYEAEPLFFKALRHEGIVSPRYFFIEVAINGNNIGLMAVEEHFSKELLESQGHRESVIIKFNEYLFHEEQNGANGIFPITSSFKNVDIQAFGIKNIMRSKTLSTQLEISRGLIRGFQTGGILASDVFDPEIMGRFLALSHLWGAWHALQWHNIRLYFNPITTKLEPIGYDAEIREYIWNKGFNNFPAGYPLASDLLSDEKILDSYKRNIIRITQENKDDSFYKRVRPFQRKYMRILHKEYPFLAPINLKKLSNRMKFKSAKTQNYSEKYKIILRAYIFKDSNNYVLELANPIPESIIISSIKWVDNDTREISDFLVESFIDYPMKLSSTKIGEAPASIFLKIKNPTKLLSSSVEISAYVLDQKQSKRMIKPITYNPVIRKPLFSKQPIKNLLKKYKFFVFDKNLKLITFKPGKWTVNDYIIIPKEVSLMITEGTEIQFNPSSGLISYGPIIIKGTKKLPVVLKGMENYNQKKSWQGIIVIDSQKLSEWSHVQIKNTSGVNIDGWSLSSGVTFYNSDIKMNYVSFDGNKSENSLNIIKSKFEIKNIIIKNTISDALDSDFSNGTIENSRFENIGSQGGGDGIDISGSQVMVSNIYFENISDKALSVGENSNLRANNVSFRNVAIGAASKDGSKLLISNAKFSRITEAGLMAYVKKTEYGPAEITAQTLEFDLTKQPAISQKGSKITIDGIETISKDL
jgi:hypothetical protein